MYVNLNDMIDESRVWIFQADRLMSEHEITSVRQRLMEFTQQWTAHNEDLKASADILHGIFIVISVDESGTGASGCSIDSMTRFIKDIGDTYGIDFFNRMTAAVSTHEEIKLIPFTELKNAAFSDPSLEVFDNLVPDLNGLRNRWKKKLADSWHASLI